MLLSCPTAASATPAPNEMMPPTSDADAIAMNQTSATESAGGFVIRVIAHYPHQSGEEASGHVTWWVESGQPPFTKTTVSAQLYAWWGFKYFAAGNRSTACTWAGTGRGKGAVARVFCRRTSLTWWYTYGEVYEPLATTKPWARHSSKAKKFGCYPW